MTYNIDNLTIEELDFLALAMDFFLCNGDIPETIKDQVEQLFVSLDIMSDDAHDENPEPRVLNKQDNVLVVDFMPKNI